MDEIHRLIEEKKKGPIMQMRMQARQQMIQEELEAGRISQAETKRRQVIRSIAFFNTEQS